MIVTLKHCKWTEKRAGNRSAYKRVTHCSVQNRMSVCCGEPESYCHMIWTSSNKNWDIWATSLEKSMQHEAECFRITDYWKIPQKGKGRGSMQVQRGLRFTLGSRVTATPAGYASPACCVSRFLFVVMWKNAAVPPRGDAGVRERGGSRTAFAANLCRKCPLEPRRRQKAGEKLVLQSIAPVALGRRGKGSPFTQSSQGISLKRK